MTLKAVVITREEPFFVAEYVTPILDSPHLEVCGLLLDKRPSPHLGIWHIWRLSGPLGFAKLIILMILSKLPCGLLLAGMPGERYPSRLARRRGIAVVKLSDDDDEMRTKITALAPELLISVANPRLLGDDILALAKVGALNSHASLLPGYRGILTGFWALFEGAAESGVSIHVMSNAIDAGRVVAQTAFAIAPDETMFSYYRKASGAGGRLWAATLAKIDRDGLDAVATDILPGDHDKMYGRPSMEEISAFRKQGNRFI